MSKILNLLISRYLTIAVAGAVFASTSGAQAGLSRNLSLASAETDTQIHQPAATAPSSPGAPTEQPKLPETTITAESKSKAKHLSTESRIIHELHRHGIYW